MPSHTKNEPPRPKDRKEPRAEGALWSLWFQRHSDNWHAVSESLACMEDYFRHPRAAAVNSQKHDQPPRREDAKTQGSFRECFQLALQVTQRLPKDVPVTRVAGRLEIAQHSGPREKQAFLLPKAIGLRRTQATFDLISCPAFSRLNLRFNTLAFPSSCHRLPA